MARHESGKCLHMITHMMMHMIMLAILDRAG